MTRLQIRRGTTTQWTNGNPILAAGEPGLDITTGNMKVGDGITNWNSLAVEWAPASLVNSAPRGVITAGIGVATDGIAINAANTFLTNLLTFNFDVTRRYRVWYVIRAVTAGYLNFQLLNINSGGALDGDMWISADRSYGGTTIVWLVAGLSGSIGIRIRGTASYTAGITVYGRDFYIEDIGAA